MTNSTKPFMLNIGESAEPYDAPLQRPVIGYDNELECSVILPDGLLAIDDGRPWDESTGTLITRADGDPSHDESSDQ